MARRIRKIKRVEIEIEVPLWEFPHDEGDFYVNQGVHQITVPCKGQPKEVWLCLDKDSAVAVCLGDIDKLGTTIVERGFIVHAEINSVSRQIRWFAELEEEVQTAADEE